MVEGPDLTFAIELERFIRRALSGDEKVPGLYQSIRNSPNWDGFQRTNGMITAYEAVFAEMRAIAKRMNSEPVEPHEERIYN